MHSIIIVINELVMYIILLQYYSRTTIIQYALEYAYYQQQ